MEETKTFGLNALSRLPEAVKDVWQNQALPIWLKMWDWAHGPLNNYVKPKIEIWWHKFMNLLGKETPDLEKEFQKEREEMEGLQHFIFPLVYLERLMNLDGSMLTYFMMLIRRS